MSNPVHDDELVPPAGGFLLATLNGEPVACGAVKLHPDAPAEIKRVWVADSVRGLGLGRRMLTELERYAAERGWTAVRLDTNRNLTEAIAMYRERATARSRRSIPSITPTTGSRSTWHLTP